MGEQLAKVSLSATQWVDECVLSVRISVRVDGDLPELAVMVCMEDNGCLWEHDGAASCCGAKRVTEDAISTQSACLVAANSFRRLRLQHSIRLNWIGRFAWDSCLPSYIEAAIHPSSQSVSELVSRAPKCVPTSWVQATESAKTLSNESHCHLLSMLRPMLAS